MSQERSAEWLRGRTIAHSIATTALAASPAEHERRIKAEALREAAKQIHERIEAIKPKAEHGFIAGLLDAKEILFRLAGVQEHIARGGKVEEGNG